MNESYLLGEDYQLKLKSQNPAVWCLQKNEGMGKKQQQQNNDPCKHNIRNQSNPL